ncbi:hypothetical protein C8N32_10849 [Rhodovulum imhoffii]|uniref:Cation/multidrug efflux pump n=1 Tax=Rhodovulum imhoffii TaxID=365340 RepID=A0A2T5BS21_9RHOB|nr:hypothetical protein [Rhodovulum imhoffii]MBK5933158.1 hypothetical protein [Rhodovulum imhoffii]PTN02098.1 hypothetical protein C8N32_10849 [Rhodovulum imhoffii]
MIAFARFFIIAFIVLTVTYIILSIRGRAAARDRLEQEWDEEVQAGDRDAYIEEGLRAYDGSLRRKLILGVYVVPAVVIGTILYVVNHM